MSAVFADTFYWIALTNKRDCAHMAVMNFTAGSRSITIVLAKPIACRLYLNADNAARGLTDVLTNDRHFEQEGSARCFGAERGLLRNRA